ncbi:ATP-grasp fold amidoligase family protein [Maribacter sp. CXY002]|uniref:ATP-grasp fold amidoligase family protein n=1 Tax=Maribacter luteocoastalis TaxID=3407671 RepID=UPI003B66C479
MNTEKILKKVYHSVRPVKYIFRKINRFKWWCFENFLSDKAFAQKKFKTGMGYKLNLESPTSLNEKINWLMLHDRTPLHTICADKYAVRAHVTKKIGDEYLVPLLFHTDDPSRLTPENLPEIPFIIKTNHNSAGLEIVYDKQKTNWSKVRDKFTQLLKQNYFTASRQWQYKNIPPRIVVEKLLSDNHGNLPEDYKFHCFNGKVRMISVDKDRNTNIHSRTWHDINWIRQPFSWSNKRKNNAGYTDPLDHDLPKPKSLEKMITLSEKLAEDFDYVRVDWYNIEGKIYFGEITFHHSGGRCPILPKEWDINLGQELKFIKSSQSKI